MLRNLLLTAFALVASGLPCHATSDHDDGNVEQRRRNLRAPIFSTGVGQFSDPMSVAPRREYPVTATSARKCPSTQRINSRWFKSQSGEDRRLMEWFHSLCDGTYIEMGALDGVTYSNSFVFNKGLGWKGVMIELSPVNYAKLVVNRPAENEQAVVNAAVCSQPQTLHYVDNFGRAVSGIYEFAAESFKHQWWSDIDLENDNVKEVQCDTLDNLLLKHTPDSQYWDFFSLDVEGAEFSVLQSVDFARVQFGVILVEADEHDVMKNLSIKSFLETKGYVFVDEYERSYWFVNGNFDAIYKDIIPIA